MSTLLAIFIREKQNWPQLIFGVGALQFRHFEASKSNQMLSILIEGVRHSPHPSSQTLACLYGLKNIHLQPSVKRARRVSAASWPRVSVLLCIVDPVSVNLLTLLMHREASEHGPSHRSPKLPVATLSIPELNMSFLRMNIVFFFFACLFEMHPPVSN